VRVVVYGSRPDGHARVVIELLATNGNYKLMGLVDDLPENAGRRIGDLEVVGGSSDLERLAKDGVEGVLLGFGAARGRAAVLDAVENAGLALPVLVHPTVHVAASAVLAPGAQLLPNASVGPGARVGRGALVNTGAIADHDVQLADAVVVGPGAVIAGRAQVGVEAEIGAGAVVLPDVRVGPTAIVGAGAVVNRDVPPGVTVAGVPARILEQRSDSAVGP